MDDTGAVPRVPVTVPRVPPSVLAGAGMLAALASGRFLANGRVGLGIAVVLAVLYFLLASFDLAAAIATWAALLFIVHLTLLGKGPTAIEILLGLAWLGAGGVR